MRGRKDRERKTEKERDRDGASELKGRERFIIVISLISMLTFPSPLS